MGLKLNFGDAFQRAPRSGHAIVHVQDMRQQRRWTRNVRYLESPNAHIVSAVLTFFLGLAAAQMWINTRLSHEGYDMTPTGTITQKADATTPRTHACKD